MQPEALITKVTLESLHTLCLDAFSISILENEYQYLFYL